ncbi:Mov34/MPN/PAD-1 family protein [Paenibacillus koleovorans]|uniref:Mov34/MPN/PAD-1 family protein n=1 Tax=Paenibacillus koleovorans TaxID=121608 RepID=UPI000FD9F4FE|nr:Mov34/MPN/PAD-1 family protein [Paenibacillus koleovorans]
MEETRQNQGGIPLKTGSVTVPSAMYESINQICITRSPEEGCGVLFGYPTDAEASEFTVTGCAFLKNAASDSCRRFQFDPVEWVPIVMNERHRLIGTFHSHPVTSAFPSEEDLSSEWSCLPVHVIVSLLPSPNWFAYANLQPNKNHSTGFPRSEWFNGLNIHISPQA